MPWSSTAFLQQSRPTFVGSNALEAPKYAIGPSERWTGSPPAEGGTDANGGTFAGIDTTEPFFGTARAYDRSFSIYTRPISAGAGNVHYLMLRVNPDMPFNMILLAGHNFGIQAGAVSVQIATADDDAFGSRLEVFTSSALVTSSSQRMYWNLPYTYQDVERLQIRISTPTPWIPFVGEVWLGNQRQLLRNPERPYDDASFASDVSQTRTKSGIITKYTRGVGRRILQLKYGVGHSSDLTAIRGFFEDTGYGSRLFLFSDIPVITTYQWWLMNLKTAELVIPRVGPFERKWEMEADESAPYLTGEP